MAAKSALAHTTAAWRRFNRRYTRFLGTLSTHYLGTEFSLAEGRVLYEIATQERPRARSVADALGLDAGYLSRILTRFERDGLVKRKTATSDRRASHLMLTARGSAAVRKLNRRADAQAHAVLTGLPETRRARLETALGEIEQTVLGVRPTAERVALRAHRPGDMGVVVQLESTGYVEQFGWDMTFEGLVARVVADFLANYNAKRDRCWIAEADGQHLGHIFLVQHPDERDTAKLRLLYVDPKARGMGLGGRLVKECVRFARAAGYKKITLWTQSILTSAHKIYAAAGFKLVREEKHRSFGKDLVGQTWEMIL